MSSDLLTPTRRISRRTRRSREPGIIRFTIEWVGGGFLGIIIGLAILVFFDAVPPGFRTVIAFLKALLL